MSKSKAEKSVADSVAADIRLVAKAAGVEPWTLTKAQYNKFGGKFSEWDVRKIGGFNSVRNSYFAPQEPKDHAIISDMSEIRREYNKLLKDFGDVERLHKRVRESLVKMPKMSGPMYKPKKATAKIERTVNAVWSDHHVGSDIVAKETNINYGKVEEARALAALTLNIAEYKTQYRDNTRLNLLILGDLIENELHDRTSADLLHIQTCRAIFIYPQAIRFLASQFRRIDVSFAVGNHGRDTAVHHSRATALKYNAIETTIYYAIRIAMSEYKNVFFHQPMTPWVEFDASGYRGYATHGDTNLNPGNPGKKVNIESLENQTNKINASLKDTDEYKIFVCGHIHQALHTRLSNGAHLFLNGALTPPNTFAQTLNIMEAPQVQVMWESVPGYPVGDVRFVDASDSAGKTKLDQIITPFKEL